jgi:hypothetical protein
MERTPHVNGRRNGYQNAMLTAIAVILALGALDRGLTDPSPALAQQPTEGGLTNRLEQNKQIIAELQKMNSKLDRIESKLSSGLSVKVTDMPAMKLPADPKAKAGDKPSSIEVKPADGK